MSPELNFGGFQRARSVHTGGGHVPAEAVSEETEGVASLVFDEYIVMRGHMAADFLSLTESNALDGCHFSSSHLAKHVPEIGIFDQHFVVPDRRRAYALLAGALKDRSRREAAAASGYEVLGFWDNGLRHISSMVNVPKFA